MIKNTTLGTALLVGSTLTSSAAFAVDSYFDGKNPLLCTLQRIYQCEIGAACNKVSAEEVGAARHLAINFKHKQITHIGDDNNRVSDIDNVEIIDEKVIMQGIEDGKDSERDGGGWSLSITDPEGEMTLTVSSHAVAFVGLGHCTPIPTK
jgi:hypothetical protein